MYRDDDKTTEPHSTAKTSPARRVGLALGGGAARGFAHIGVLRVLAEAGIEVEAIAGTSIGAVIGACHAAGRLAEVEAWARSLTKRRVFSLLDFSIQGSGLISGGRLSYLLARDLGQTAIEDLAYPFAAVATEIGTGHEVWLTRGPVVKALRASYALPGIFEPVHVGGRWLMDGALVNPVPVSTVRALGARAVLAVNLSGEMGGRGTVVPGHGGHSHEHEDPDRGRPNARVAFGAAASLLKRQLGLGGKRPSPAREARAPGISAVIIDAFNVTQDRISRSRLAGDPPDFMILPRLGKIGLFEFHRAAEIIELGAEATRRSLDMIEEAVDSLT